MFVRFHDWASGKLSSLADLIVAAHPVELIVSHKRTALHCRWKCARLVRP